MRTLAGRLKVMGMVFRDINSVTGRRGKNKSTQDGLFPSATYRLYVVYLSKVAETAQLFGHQLYFAFLFQLGFKSRLERFKGDVALALQQLFG